MIKKMFKRTFASLLIPASFIASPFLATSCAVLPTGDIDRPAQIELLSSEAAKNTLMDNWLTSTFTSLYAKSIAAQNESLETTSNVQNTLNYYLLNLSWPTTTNTPSKPITKETKIGNNVVYGTLTDDQKNKFENLVKEAYKFYISFKSTISETTSDSETKTNPIVYFIEKANAWKSQELNTIIPIYSSKNPSTLLTIQDFNPSLKYTGLDSTNNALIEDDFKILMSTRGTLVYQNVLKLLISEMYFLHSTEKLIKNGTNYNKMTRNMSSVDYINTQAYVGLNNDFSTFMLKKYMIENSPQLLWSYAAEDYTTSTLSPSIISTITDFNNLSTTKDTQLSTILAPDSTEDTTNQISKLQAFNSCQVNANADQGGDLSSNIDNLKMFGDNKGGLFDSTTSMLFSFTELNAIKEILKYNANSSNTNKLSIPSINIKSTSTSKKSHSITINDLDVVWDNQTITPTNNVFKSTTGNVTQELKINSISYLPAKGEEKEIVIAFTYSFQNKNGSSTTKHSFDYNFTISNWGNNESSQQNPFAKQYQFSGSDSQVGIKIFDNSTSLGISYYLRFLPLWKGSESISIGGNNWYSKGYWTFENTPWNTVEKQQKLVYFFVLSDSNLFTNIQDFYLFNNYNVEAKSYEISSLVSSLGLTKKTDNDRRDAGIIY